MTGPSIIRLGSPASAGPNVLIVGTGTLLGTLQQGLSAAALPSRFAEQALPALGPTASIDVLWNLGTSLRSMVALSSTGRLPVHNGIIVVIEPLHVLAAGRRLRHELTTALPLTDAAPAIVVVLASRPSSSAMTRQAEERIRDIAAGLPRSSDLTVLHAAVGQDGAIQDSTSVATAALQSLGLETPVSTDPLSREVAVDRSFRALRGRTSHLRRALILAQNTFDVPYAQLNLVSHGTLRSLAYIGRSSDGLRRSLSAETVHMPGPLLVHDTQQTRRFDSIPETQGPDAIRYYVGHAVRARSGHPIGVLCVLDTQPHEITDGDDVLIRDLALLAEGELDTLTEPS